MLAENLATRTDLAAEVEVEVQLEEELAERLEEERGDEVEVEAGSIQIKLFVDTNQVFPFLLLLYAKRFKLAISPSVFLDQNARRANCMTLRGKMVLELTE